MLLLWYPQPYFAICEGMTVLSILVITDVVLGPILTFIIYKPKKPWLKLDLSIIATVQICALIYGGNIIYGERPLFMVFAIDRFELVLASETDIDINNIQHKEILHSPTPHMVFAKMPDDKAIATEIVTSSIFSGKGLEVHPEYFEPITPYMPKILREARNIKDLINNKPGNAALIEFSKKLGDSNIDYKFLHAVVNNKNITAVISNNGTIIDFIDVSPKIPETEAIKRNKTENTTKP